MMLMKYPFIVFEGLDGAGKSTQIALLSKWLSSIKIANQTFREPGSTEIGEQLRAIIKNHTLPAETELLLFAAARSLLMPIIEKTMQDQIVLCDRYIYSTWAYQHYGRNLCAEKIHQAHNIINCNLIPDLVIYMPYQYRTSNTDNLEKIPSNIIDHGYRKFVNENWLITPNDTKDNIANFIQTEVRKRFLNV